MVLSGAHLPEQLGTSASNPYPGTAERAIMLKAGQILLYGDQL